MTAQARIHGFCVIVARKFANRTRMRVGVPAGPVAGDFIGRLRHETERFPELAGPCPGELRPARRASHRESGPGRYLRRNRGERGGAFLRRIPLRSYRGELQPMRPRFTAREFSDCRPRWRDTLKATYHDSYCVVRERQNNQAVCVDGGVLMWSLSDSLSV